MRPLSWGREGNVMRLTLAGVGKTPGVSRDRSHEDGRQPGAALRRVSKGGVDATGIPSEVARPPETGQNPTGGLSISNRSKQLYGSHLPLLGSGPVVKSRKGHAIGVTASERKSSAKQLCILGQFQVWQEVWQRIPKAELANLLFQE